MYWICPKCSSRVDFEKQMGYLFEDDGEASFDPNGGIYFHTISCENENCSTDWVMCMSGMDCK